MAIRRANERPNDALPDLSRTGAIRGKLGLPRAREVTGGYQMDQLEEMTDAEIDSVLDLHDRRRGNIFRFPERRASENDRRSLERWFGIQDRSDA